MAYPARLAEDVAALLDHLGIDRLPMVGVSGGGPYAMACALAMPERVTRIGLVSSAVLPDEVEPIFEGYFDEDERRLLNLVRADAEAALPDVEDSCRWLVESPEVLTDPAGWPEADRWAPADPETRAIMLQETREAGRQGTVGYVWDKMNVDFLPWGFAPSDVRVEAFVWHADSERMPLGIYEYLTSTIPGAHGTVWTGVGHLAITRDGYWGEVLQTIAA